MRRDGLRAVLRLAAWSAGLVVAARVLLATGSETLSVPLTSLDDLSTWVSDTPPADMVVALVRLAGLAATAYLSAVTALTAAARLVRWHGLTAAVDRISPDVVRRLAAGGSGIGLVLGGAVAAVPFPDLGTRPDRDAVASAPVTPAEPAGVVAPSAATMSRLPGATATMTRVDDAATTPVPGPDADTSGADPAAEPGTRATMTVIDAPPSPSATMTRLDSAAPAPPPAGTTPVAFAPAAAGVPPVPAPPAAPEIDLTTWIVEPGDSLWSIAEDVIASPAGSRPGERAVGRYWQRLVQVNRPHLVDPDNPDLLVPGQQLVVPSPDG